MIDDRVVVVVVVVKYEDEEDWLAGHSADNVPLCHCTVVFVPWLDIRKSNPKFRHPKSCC